jgi:hypothetical protein
VVSVEDYGGSPGTGSHPLRHYVGMGAREAQELDVSEPAATQQIRHGLSGPLYLGGIEAGCRYTGYAREPNELLSGLLEARIEGLHDRIRRRHPAARLAKRATGGAKSGAWIR